ncbi:MAG: CsbD family protein [Actinomycetota bacterium]|nr:CsbD family protein [Actinomycetota bacterium]
MANEDKLNNKIDESTGKLKETAGRATGDEQLQAEGQGQKEGAQFKDKLQDAASKVKEAFKK